MGLRNDYKRVALAACGFWSHRVKQATPRVKGQCWLWGFRCSLFINFLSSNGGKGRFAFRRI